MAGIGAHPSSRVDAGEHSLKAWRDWLGWDHRHIGEATGIRVEKLDKMERGIIRLTKTTAVKVGRAMGIAAINLMPMSGCSCSDLGGDEDAVLGEIEDV